MIGLKDGIVIISEYDDSWANEFEKEKNQIQNAIQGSTIFIEHFGSTSIAGLCAKPIIDILIGIKSFDDALDYVQPLESIGYTFKGENGIRFRHYYEKGNPRTHHVHMVEVNGKLWIEQLIFRNYLRKNQKAKDDYAVLKRKSALKYPADRDKYLDSKAGFIQEIIQKAKKG